MASRLGFSDVEFATVLPETRKDMLMNGEIDCLVACYSIAESRQKNFDFSAAYYADDSVIVVENSSLVDDVEDLKGLTFGTMAGSNTAPQLVIKLTESGFTSGEALSASEDNSDVQFDTFHLVQMASYQELAQALEEGRIDAACMDGSIAKTYMSSGPQHPRLYDRYAGVWCRHDKRIPRSASRCRGRGRGMLDDGTIARLTDKWN